MKNLFVIIVIAALLTSCCGEGKECAKKCTKEECAKKCAANEESTKAVIEHHLGAFGSGNIDSLLADYTEESVILTPNGTLKGLEEIKALFEGMFPLFPAEGSEFVLDKMEINNQLGYIVWHANTPVVVIPLGTDSFIVKDGKIMQQTFAAKLDMVETEEEVTEDVVVEEGTAE